MPHISYLDTTAPKAVEGAKIRIEANVGKKPEMRNGIIKQRTNDLIVVEFPYRHGKGSFIESFRVMDLAAEIIKWEVIG